MTTVRIREKIDSIKYRNAQNMVRFEEPCFFDRKENLLRKTRFLRGR